ncbi:MAG: hypothetical protein JWO83_78 [Caulobacteraceae bacterium]|nr:hypothetical protein [Caulobacteraceae bacterium]
MQIATTLTRPLTAGADLALYSLHKFLGGPTGGIVAGRRDLVRAAFLQNGGIGRGMKIGKEGVAGAIAELDAWERRDHAAVRARETQALHLWRETLQGRPGVTAAIVPDPTNDPLDRLQVAVEPAPAHITAWDLADRLAAGRRPVIVRALGLAGVTRQRCVKTRLGAMAATPQPSPTMTPSDRMPENGS